MRDGRRVLRRLFPHGMIQLKMMHGYCPFLLLDKHFISHHCNWVADAKIQRRKRA